MSQMSIGIIETIGLAAAIEAADVCLKSANVTLIGYELTRGNGMTVVKIEGNVGAVKAAIEAATVAANKVSKVYSKKVIPRPSDGIGGLIRNEDTVGYEDEKESNQISNKGIAEENSKLDNNELDSKDNQEDIEEQDDIDFEEVDEEYYDEETEEIEETEETEETTNERKKSDKGYTCNLCKDPKCPRQKGDLKIDCIHYDEKNEN